MKKEIKYFIIGGGNEFDYAVINKGGAYTLEEAKRLATKYPDYWDSDAQTMCKPDIFRAEDCEMCEGTFHGDQFLPKDDALPVLVWRGKKWVKPMYKFRVSYGGNDLGDAYM